MDPTTFYVKPGTSAERKDLYERLDAKNTAPLWEVLGKLVTPEPQSACVPALWRYDEIRPLHDRERGGAPRPRPREPGCARALANHLEPVRRRAARQAWRSRAEPSP